jgi:hypothetical protein
LLWSCFGDAAADDENDEVAAAAKGVTALWAQQRLATALVVRKIDLLANIFMLCKDIIYYLLFILFLIII